MTFSILPSTYHFLEREKYWQHFWEEKQLYNWDSTADRATTFVVDTPPPTVSGQLHIGHICSYAQTDFIVRFQRMLGKNIFYPMGFDDNGLPTERLVEKQKGIRAAHMNRSNFVQLCQEVILEAETKFRNLFKAIALSIDWNLEYQTISPLSCRLSQMSFLALLEKGEIYRKEQPILWDPIDGTALAQADVEDKERMTYMNDILFCHAATQAALPVATTRPELLPACVALFYHPDDTRYQHLANSYALTPIFAIQVPILADRRVQPEKGTGLVMCCTFGDQTDVAWWKQHQLPTQIILSKEGIITANHAGPLKGLTVRKARERIIQILKEKALLVKQIELLQSVKCAERSGAPLEILTTPQWFVRTLVHKNALLARMHQLQWYPVTMKNRLETWIHGLAWDWCISRQRYFGVPFPIWYSKRVGEEGKILLPTFDQLPVNPLEDLPLGYTQEEVTPDYDVMDTWATSSLSPQLSTHTINKTFSLNYARHTQLFPMDLRPQAHEIIPTWTFYTLLKAHLHEDSLPWKNIMIHGWCLTPDQNKMSKSKGNVILPETVLEQYGADVLRYWSANARLGTDTCYCANVIKNGKRLITKLWNAAKFITFHINQLPEADFIDATPNFITHTLDKWLLQAVTELVKEVHTHFMAYNYTEALLTTERFFWSFFCDDYVEISKARLYNTATAWTQQDQQSATIALYQTFYFLLQLLAPILPYITEELAQGLYPYRGSIHQRNNWPKGELSVCVTPSQRKQVAHLREIVALVRKAKTDQKLSIKAAIQMLTIQGTVLDNDLLRDLQAVTAATTVLYSDPTTWDDSAVQITGKNCSVGIVWA